MADTLEQTYLLAFVVDVYPERGILFLEPVERAREIRRFSTNWLDGE